MKNFRCIWLFAAAVPAFPRKRAKAVITARNSKEENKYDYSSSRCIPFYVNRPHRTASLSRSLPHWKNAFAFALYCVKVFARAAHFHDLKYERPFYWTLILVFYIQKEGEAESADPRVRQHSHMVLIGLLAICPQLKGTPSFVTRL